MSNQDNIPELDSRPQSRREWHGWLRSVVLPLGLIVAIVAGLLYFQSNRGGDSVDDGFGIVQLPAGKNPTSDSPSAAVGRAAPDFLLSSLDGDPLRLSDLQGHPLLINFWASWCQPCREETPDLIQLYEDHEAQGLQLLGVNLREADGPVRSFVDEFGVPYPIVFDRNGQVAGTWRIGGPNNGIPSTYFIDPQGVVQKVVYGSLTDKQVSDGLALILKAGELMAGASFESRLRWSGYDPLKLLWRGLTSVRFALGLIAFLALSSLLGVIITQLPADMRGNPEAVTLWFTLQQEHYGFLYEPMRKLGFFEIFRSLWFVSGLALLAASVCVCTANRLPPIWRNVFQPQKRVPDEYLLNNDASVAIEAPSVERIVGELKRRRYRVTATRDGDATFVFADRYPWAQFATFVSHLALILFLAGGFVTVITAREQQIFIAEGEAPLPVFSLSDPDHMQIYVEDAVGAFDASGFPRDFHTDLVVYKDGKEVARGPTSVNNPLSYGGYRFHQSAYFPDGAALTVRDVNTGRVVYDQVLALTAQAPTPRVVVRDPGGNILLDDTIVPTDFISVGDTAGTSIQLPGTDRSFWLGARPSDADTGWQLIVFETADPAGARGVISEGQDLDVDGMTFTFVGMTDLPSTVVSGVPGLTGANGVAEMSTGPSGDLLTVGPVSGSAVALSPGQPVTVGTYEYTFTGKREFAGITVRRDPGSMLIWFGTGMLLLGLALTFYTPRRRLWGKIASGQAWFRGLGGRRLTIDKEIREVAARAGRS